MLDNYVFNSLGPMVQGQTRKAGPNYILQIYYLFKCCKCSLQWCVHDVSLHPEIRFVAKPNIPCALSLESNHVESQTLAMLTRSDTRMKNALCQPARPGSEEPVRQLRPSSRLLWQHVRRAPRMYHSD